MENYVSNLNMRTPINKVYNTIRKIKGKGTAEKYKHPGQAGQSYFYRQKGNINIQYDWSNYI